MDHYHDMITQASLLLSTYFQQPIHFSKVSQLSEPDRRNVILRLELDKPTSAMPQSLILKKNSLEKRVFEGGENETEIEQLTRFAHDWAGIEFLTQLGSKHAPHFYAGNLEHKFIIIEDLGLHHPSLVGPLTRAPSPSNYQEAKSALLSYMRRLGKMHANTAGKSAQFYALLKKIYPSALRYNYLSETDIEIALKQFKILLGKETKELSQELKAVQEFSLATNEFKVFLHGDVCPDNVYYQDQNLRFIDFEFGDFGNALVDGSYLRMHMPTCWCAKAIPEALVVEMEASYREELALGVSSASDDTLYNKQQAYSCAYWLVRTLRQLQDMDLISQEWVCPSGPLDSDSLWEPEKNAFRPRILSRLNTFIACSTTTDHLPHLREAAKQLQTHLRAIWPKTQGLDFFPVFL